MKQDYSAKVKMLILKHVKSRESFKEVPEPFMRSFERNGKRFTCNAMDGEIERHLETTVKKILELEGGK